MNNATRIQAAFYNCILILLATSWLFFTGCKPGNQKANANCNLSQSSCTGCTMFDLPSCMCVAPAPKFTCSAHGTYDAVNCRCNCEAGWGGKLCDSLLTVPSGNYLRASCSPSFRAGYTYSADTIEVELVDNAGANNDSLKIDGYNGSADWMYFILRKDAATMVAPFKLPVSVSLGNNAAWFSHKDASNGMVLFGYSATADTIYVDEFTKSPLHIKGRVHVTCTDGSSNSVGINDGVFNYTQ